MFEKSEIEPEFREPTKEEIRRAKISAFAKKRGRTRLGKFYKKRVPKWEPTDEYIEMVRQTILGENFPKRRFRVLKYKKRVRFFLKTRGYDEIRLRLKGYYTPEHIRQFLKLYLRWTPERRSRGGRPRKNGPDGQVSPQKPGQRG